MERYTQIMSEGAIGRIIERIRAPFQRKPIVEIPSLDERDPLSPPQELEEKKPELIRNFSHDSARELLRLAKTRHHQGLSLDDAFVLIGQSPLLKITDFSPQNFRDVEGHFSESTVEVLANLIPENTERDVKRNYKKWLYEQYKTDQRKNKQEPQNPAPPQELVKPPTTAEPELIAKRPVIVEGMNKSTPVESDINLETYLTKARSEIKLEDLKKIVEFLRTTDAKELSFRYRKKVASGAFEGYSVVPRGRTGRLLFFIDENNVLHIRVGKHKEIYERKHVGSSPLRS